MISVAILCGGKGTRAHLPINKCFIDVAGRPFILRLMDQLEENGFTTIVCCRGDQGRLEALKNARKQLGERFIVLYGDTYLPLDFGLFIDTWNNSAKPVISAEYNGVDAGVNGYATYVLDHAPTLDTLKVRLAKRDLIYKFKVTEKWQQVGDPQGLLEAEEWFAERDAWTCSDSTSMVSLPQEQPSNTRSLSYRAEPSLSMMNSFDV